MENSFNACCNGGLFILCALLILTACREQYTLGEMDLTTYDPRLGVVRQSAQGEYYTIKSKNEPQDKDFCAPGNAQPWC